MLKQYAVKPPVYRNSAVFSVVFYIINFMFHIPFNVACAFVSIYLLTLEVSADHLLIWTSEHCSSDHAIIEMCSKVHSGTLHNAVARVHASAFVNSVHSKTNESTFSCTDFGNIILGWPWLTVAIEFSVP